MHMVYNVENSSVLMNIKTKYYYIENSFYTEWFFLRNLVFSYFFISSSMNQVCV